jgi:GWxTD domain-containing protein
VCTIGSLHSQSNGKKLTRFGFEINVIPPIHYDLYLSYNEETNKLRVNLRINIQNDLLYFTRTAEGYIAGYDIAVTIERSWKTDEVFSKEFKETVYSNLWKQKIVAQDFELTNSRSEYQVDSKIFDAELSTGKYKFKIVLTDAASGNSCKSERDIEIPELDTPLIHGIIKMLSEKDSLSAEIILKEQLPAVRFNKNMLARIEFLLAEPAEIVIKSELQALGGEATQVIRQEMYTVKKQDQHIVSIELIDKKYLPEGKYKLIYMIVSKNETYQVEKDFQVIWFNKPIYLYDPELAIGPMRYILAKEDWINVENLSDEKLVNWFDNFWKEKDDEPDTPLNEIQLEFYNRVMQADKRFAAESEEGWNTERGKALILYGTPDRIDAKPYRTGSKPYEVWYYDSINKKLVFIDENDNNSYRLVSEKEIGDNPNE